MCGIAGILSFDERRSIDEASIRRMTDALEHRGPDDEGVVVRGQIGLGSRRLAIIDLSPAGHMPMASADGAITIAFNGEIYNFHELRAELESHGVRFRSHTDTEVLIELYRRHGTAAIHRLRGMFAFALWDERRGMLWLARDRFGKKPLKYYLDGKRCVFASELKAILTHADVPRGIDWSAVDEYLTYKYVPHPKTGFLGIAKLPPAHMMTIERSGTVHTERYWKLDATQHDTTLSEAAWKERVRTELETAVRLRMISDVPIGAHLSGGVDSGIVTALMARQSSTPITTFSIGFDDPRYDERTYARAIAQQYGTEHHELIIKPNDLVTTIDALAYSYEEPYADASALPTWHLAQLTRQHATVALNGDGGDELFGGYDRYAATIWHARTSTLPGMRLLAPHLARIAQQGVQLGGGIGSLLHRAGRFLEASGEDSFDFFLHIVSYATEAEKKRLYQASHQAQVTGSRGAQFLRDAWDEAGTTDLLSRLLYTDSMTNLPNDLLVKVDIAAMAHSVEVRSPLLDHTLAETAAQLPAHFKLRGTTKKYLLKKIAEDLLPYECVYRPKQGFSVPLRSWFAQDLDTYLRAELLDPAFIQMGFEKTTLETLLNTHQRGRAHYENQLWALIMLKRWMVRYNLIS